MLENYCVFIYLQGSASAFHTPETEASILVWFSQSQSCKNAVDNTTLASGDHDWCVPVWNGPGCVTAHDLHIPDIAAQTWTLILRVCQSSWCAMKANLRAAPFSHVDRHSALKTTYPHRSIKNIK